MRKYIWLLLIVLPLLSQGQVIIRTDLITDSKLKDDHVPEDEPSPTIGSGDMLKYSLQGTLPVFYEQNDSGQPTAWLIGFNAAYATMSNHDAAKALVPSKLFNAGLNLAHVRPLSERWLLMCSLGAGFYSDTHDTSWQQVLGSGGAIFAYQWRPNLLVGVGGGVSNALGLPMLMPMLYLRYSLEGKYEFSAELTSTIKIAAARKWDEHWKLELNALEGDGMSAIVKREGDWKLFGMMQLSGSISPVYYFSEKTSIFASVGVDYARSVQLSERSLKSIFNDNTDYRFNPAPHISIGFRYGM